MHKFSKHLLSVPAETTLTTASNEDADADVPSSLAGLAPHPAGSKQWPQPQPQQKYPPPSPALSRDPSEWTGDATAIVLGDSAGQDLTAHLPSDRSPRFSKAWRGTMSEDTVACGVAAGGGRGWSGGDNDPSESICSGQGEQGERPQKRHRIRYCQDEVGGEAADEVESPFMPRPATYPPLVPGPAPHRTYNTSLAALPALQRTPTATAGRLPQRSPAGSPSTRKPLSSLGPGSPRLSPAFDSAPHPWTPLPSTAHTLLPEIVPLAIPLQLSDRTSGLYSQHLPRQQPQTQQQDPQHAQSLLLQQYFSTALKIPSPHQTHSPSPLPYESPVMPLPSSEAPRLAVLPLLTPITSQTSVEGPQGGGWGVGADTDADWCAKEVAAVEARWASGVNASHWTPFPRGSRAAETGKFYVPERLPHDMDVEE